MSTISFEKLVYDWASSRVSGNTLRYLSTKRWRRLDPSGDTLNSYGSHFPLIQLIRKRSGKPSHWLLNGDTWGGGWSLTSDHQSAVLHYAKNSDLPYVIVPQSVLDAAGIDTSTVQIVDVTTDTYETIVEDFDHLPEGSRWVYDEITLPGTGGWVNQVTGEWKKHGYPDDHTGYDVRTYVIEAPGTPRWEYGTDYAEHERALAAHRKLWVWYPGVIKNTGRKRLMVSGRGRHSYMEYDIYADEQGATRYRYSWQRHWLGESLIKAAVPYRAVVKCPTCQGTGAIEPYAVVVGRAEGPMTQVQHDRQRRWAGPQEEGWDRTTLGSRITDECTRCEHRSGRISVMKRRWAYYLSGFDHLELNRSYFFTELPPRQHPTTVAEAYDTLKPATVRLAEEMGRTVLRQGDQFFIEMPELTLRQLKAQGGVHHKRGGPGREYQQYQPENPQHWQIPRFQRYINEDCWMNGTTHEASEVVRVGAVTYARGIVRHVPDGRAPDHAVLTLGDRKTWFLNVPNLTPVGR